MKLIYRTLGPVARRFPWLARFYREYRESRSLSKAPSTTPHGFKFSGNPAMEDGTFEPAESRVILQYLHQSEIFINIGANIGYYCCMALQQGIQTLAFEPIDLNLKYLFKNLCVNGWEKQIEIFPVAVGDRIGLIDIYGGGTGASLIKGWSHTPEYYKRSVPVSTLDCLIGSRFEGKRCLILADIEGAELSMLRGAGKLLRLNPKPVWIVEICISEHMPRGVQINPTLMQTFELFWNHGYQSWTCDQRHRPVEKSEIEAVIKMGKDTLGTHNFIFEAARG